MDSSLQIPDARDGLRPVDRRVLSVMEPRFGRSFSIVGEVQQRFSGQGGRAAYDALVRMTQHFVVRYPLINGEGNFGSIDGDSAATARYTEARLSDFGAAVRSDDPRAVEWRVDGGELRALPSSVPNLLVNGASTPNAIFPPHNLREVVSALIHLIDHPDATDAELRNHTKGPDFPTGGCIQGVAGIRDYQETGRGQITIRARTEIETWAETRIAVSELPYRTDGARLCESIATAVRDGRIDGIRDLRNESDWDGIRILILPKPGVEPHALLNTLYERTAMQTTLTLALVGSVPDAEGPRTMSLKELLGRYIAHRDECIARRASPGAPSTKAERMLVLKDELTYVAERFGDRRRTDVV